MLTLVSLTKEILKTGGTFHMPRLTNFILTKLLMKKVGIRKEVWLQCNSTSLKSSYFRSGYSLLRFNCHTFFSSCIINNQHCKILTLEFLYRKMYLPMLWSTASRIWTKVMGKSWALGCYASKWNQSICSGRHINVFSHVNEIYKFVIIITWRMLIWAPLFFYLVKYRGALWILYIVH